MDKTSTLSAKNKVASSGTPSLCHLIRSDISANRRNWKGFILILMYRLAHAHLSAPIYVKPITFIYLIFYKFFTEMIVGTEIHWRCKIGPGACVYHGYGLVINSETKIGSHVILRHGVTIGSKSAGIEQSPDIGDYVDVGAAAIILGQTKIGNRVIIGAGSVVLKDIPDDAVAAGNPCRVIRIRPAVEPSH